MDLTALLDVSEKDKFLHPVGIYGVCRKECSSLIYFCRRDIFNYICGADSKFVITVNSRGS